MTTAGAVVTATGTEFLVHSRQGTGITWVIGLEDEVTVAGAVPPHAAVTVPEGWFTVVDLTNPANNRPWSPMPATRAVLNRAFGRVALPPLDDLGPGSLKDDELPDPGCAVDAAADIPLRAAPRPDAAVLASASPGDPFEAMFRTQDGAWLRGVAGLADDWWAPAAAIACDYDTDRLPWLAVPATQPGGHTPTPKDPEPDTGAGVTVVPATTPPTFPPAITPTVTPTSVPADTTPPTAPSPLSPIDGHAYDCLEWRDVVLSWTAVSDESGIARYAWTLEQSSAGPDGPYAPFTANTTAATKTKPLTLECGASYRWRVRAVDGVGLVGPDSAPAGFRIGDPVG